MQLCVELMWAIQQGYRVSSSDMGDSYTSDAALGRACDTGGMRLIHVGFVLL